MASVTDKICYEYKNTGRCKFGSRCKFSHQRRAQNWRQRAASGAETESNPRDAKSRLTSTESYRTWLFKIPRDTTYVEPLGAEQAEFFQESYRLASTDADTMQSVVTKLASEGGLRRVKELLEQDFESMTKLSKLQIFQSRILPFFKLVTKSEVIDSLILEGEVARLYNFLFGINGVRAIPLFNYVSQVITSIDRESHHTFEALESSTVVLCKVHDINSHATILKPLAEAAKILRDVFLELRGSHNSHELLVSEKYIQRLFNHLKLGLAIPDASLTLQKSREKPTTAFVTSQDPPGGRHDNDFEDICRIKILPTSEEIRCKRSEYLPDKDPSQWHVGGVDGLLDRNFRLLREDTVGQLRDAVQIELQRRSSGTESNAIKFNDGIRTRAYHNGSIDDIRIDRFHGLCFAVRFLSPPGVKNLKTKERADWWARSKRLQSDALVCIVNSEETALFCTIVGLPSTQDNRDSSESNKVPESLYKDERYTTVHLTLVNQEESNVQCILDKFISTSTPIFISVIEFPGVLLPSFYPTLEAIQKIKKSGDLPFADYLAPPERGGYVEVPQPAYTRVTGFNFNLKPVTSLSEDLHLVPGRNFSHQKLIQNTSLDEAQATSLIEALSKQFALIQGPPGTGKSYTGVATLKVLLSKKIRHPSKFKIGPILCICYTNHALDQLLEDVIDSGITSQIIRVGTRSKNERLQEHNLRVAVRRLDKTRGERHALWQTSEEMEKLERIFRELSNDLEMASSAKGIKKYLLKYRNGYYNQLFGEDEEGFQQAGSQNAHKIFQEWLKSGPNTTITTLPERRELNLHLATRKQRYGLHQKWIQDNRELINQKLIATANAFRLARDEHERTRNECDLRCLRMADVIGITTSGLARKIDVLRRVQSKVLLCEEAGEVLEPHLLAALLPSLDHAILIGDHQQLRPQVQNFELSRENHRGGAKYCLDVSLFERLVVPNVDTAVRLPFSTLNIQRRMHPLISQLIRETLYPSLLDHESVLTYPAVSGLRKRLFWLDHEVFESDAAPDSVSTSHRNNFEIEMVSALVMHIIQQGIYKSGEVAVLTPYLGQLQHLRHRLQRSFAITVDERDERELMLAGLAENDPATNMQTSTVVQSNLLQALRVATIDNFQGEEAKIVIISLVRSNAQRRCGFLKTSNRINVLLSRAKHGMYIIGNSQTSSHVAMWAQVVDILRKEGNIGTELELQCPRHPEKEIRVSKPDHFTVLAPEGGCDAKCAHRLSCGHACIKRCHSDHLHGAVRCLEACPRPLKGCDHPCPNYCGDSCPQKCKVPMKNSKRTLPCGHFKPVLPCWQAQDLSLVTCLDLVERTVPRCKHKVSVPCYQDVGDPAYTCSAECGQLLLCGHTCRRKCSECRTYTDEGKTLIDHGQCTHICGRQYSTCAHSCRQACHGEQPCKPCDSSCEVWCGHSQCPRICSEPCVPCAEERCLSSCPHSSCSLPCGAPCDHVPCSKRCDKELACGHRCPSVCGEYCPEIKFCVECAGDDIKCREVDFLEGMQYKDVNLDHNPCIFPKCGHFLTIESMDGFMELQEFYLTSEVHGLEIPIALKDTAVPFSMKDVKTCPSCRGSLRDLTRYGRLVRRALLDESTKKLVLWINQAYIPLANDLQERIDLAQGMHGKSLPDSFARKQEVSLSGNRENQVFTFGQALGDCDYHGWIELKRFRKRLTDYRNRVRLSEQPFKRVRDGVEAIRQRTGRETKFEFDESILQTKGFLLATSLLLRLDIVLLIAFLSLNTASSNVNLKIKYTPWMTDCQDLLKDAEASHRLPQQVEALIFLAQLLAIQRSRCEEPSRADDLRMHGEGYLSNARNICSRNQSQTAGLLEEVEMVEKMLRDSTFYTTVSNEERMAVLRAMATEMRGTGHWYYCENNHPFTIGECGMPMEQARCPECNAPVGGQNHQAVLGTSRAEDLEEQLRDLRVQ